MRTLKYLFLACLLISSYWACKSAQNSKKSSALVQASVNTIYLVRHAEKSKEGGRDPVLTSQGETRAQRLAQMLSDANISQVYSTNYIRTKSTAQPTADQFELAIQTYNPRDTAFYRELLNLPDGNNALVVGHSNTTPMLVNQLLGRKAYPQLKESEYSKIFMLTKIGEQVICTQLNY